MTYIPMSPLMKWNSWPLLQELPNPLNVLIVVLFLFFELRFIRVDSIRVILRAVSRGHGCSLIVPVIFLWGSRPLIFFKKGFLPLNFLSKANSHFSYFIHLSIEFVSSLRQSSFHNFIILSRMSGCRFFWKCRYTSWSMDYLHYIFPSFAKDQVQL